MGNILRSQKQQQKPQEPVDPHGLKPATAAIAALTRDLRSFESSSVVNVNCIGDGDGFTAYVAIRDDPRELANVPQEVIIICSGNEILARKYRIRLRGVDAPELKMPYGKESKNALEKLIGGKSTKIYVYGQDQFERYVGDIYCDSVFIQEEMLRNGHAWHFKNYDRRPEFSAWERKARAARKGLWASRNPEKPWHWRRDERNERHGTIEVYSS
ncbi:hypothetical protein ACQ4PT_042747 [Festuca glaucescens]